MNYGTYENLEKLSYRELLIARERIKAKILQMNTDDEDFDDTFTYYDALAIELWKREMMLNKD